MAFGKNKNNDATDDIGEGPVDAAPEIDEADELDGPFDIEDFDDVAVAQHGRLDLGSVLVPTPEGGQVQVELNEGGVPSAVWMVTPNGRFTIAAYAAPKSAALWREVATELADSLKKETAAVRIVDGPWGREVVGTAAAPTEGGAPGVVRFIGIDGYRWMVRCVVNGTAETIDKLSEEARDALADTVVRRGDTPMPVRTPLAIELPEPMAAQLRAAALAAGQQIPPQAEAPAPPSPEPPPPPQPTARRSVQGSAMQQLRTITGG